MQGNFRAEVVPCNVPSPSSPGRHTPCEQPTALIQRGNNNRGMPGFLKAAHMNMDLYSPHSPQVNLKPLESPVPFSRPCSPSTLTSCEVLLSKALPPISVSLLKCPLILPSSNSRM